MLFYYRHELGWRKTDSKLRLSPVELRGLRVPPHSSYDKSVGCPQGDLEGSLNATKIINSGLHLAQNGGKNIAGDASPESLSAANKYEILRVDDIDESGESEESPLLPVPVIVVPKTTKNTDDEATLSSMSSITLPVKVIKNTRGRRLCHGKRKFITSRLKNSLRIEKLGAELSVIRARLAVLKQLTWAISSVMMACGADGGWTEEVKKTSVADKHEVKSSLNGCNGEATNDDDRGKGTMSSNAKKKLGREVKNFGKEIGVRGSAGAIFGRMVNGLRQRVDAIEGRGDYKVSTKRKQSAQRGFGGVGAKYSRSKSGGIIVEHSEYVADLESGTNAGFTSYTYPLNPGIITTFPWLSSLAANFQQYKLRKMVFEYRPNVSTAVSSANGLITVGQVILATQYNSVAAPYSNKIQMENCDYNMSGAPNKPMMHAIECKKNQSVLDDLYVRFGNIPQNSDLRMYDMGFFQIASNGVPTNSTVMSLGEIHVHYEVELLKPQLNGGLLNVLSGSWLLTGSAVCPTLPLSTITMASNSLLDLTFAARSITFPDLDFGAFAIQIIWNGSSASTLGIPAFTFTNCTQLVASTFSPDNGQIAKQVSVTLYILVNATGSLAPVISWTGGSGVTATQVVVNVSPWNIGVTPYG